jgi:hypothetical protein
MVEFIPVTWNAPSKLHLLPRISTVHKSDYT